MFGLHLVLSRRATLGIDNSTEYTQTDSDEKEKAFWLQCIKKQQKIYNHNHPDWDNLSNFIQDQSERIIKAIDAGASYQELLTAVTSDTQDKSNYPRHIKRLLSFLHELLTDPTYANDSSIQKLRQISNGEEKQPKAPHKFDELKQLVTKFISMSNPAEKKQAEAEILNKLAEYQQQGHDMNDPELVNLIPFGTFCRFQNQLKKPNEIGQPVAVELTSFTENSNKINNFSR